MPLFFALMRKLINTLNMDSAVSVLFFLEAMATYLRMTSKGISGFTLKFSMQVLVLLTLTGAAASLMLIGELSGEFGQIRQLASNSKNALTVTRGNLVCLNNGVLFGFDVDGEGNGTILKVQLATNQTFSWRESIEQGKRIFRNENFTLGSTDCSFTVDVTVQSYGNGTLQIIDNTECAEASMP